MGAILKSIRGAIRDRLYDRTAAGTKVFTNRADKVWQESIPSIVIYTRSETVERDQAAPPEYKRTARVVIELLLQDRSGFPLDDDTDDLAEEVEALLFADPTLRAELGDVVSDGRQVGYEVSLADGGEVLIAGARITWEFVYFQAADVGSLAELAPWKEARSTYSTQPETDG
jgi:hypothetical protein